MSAEQPTISKEFILKWRMGARSAKLLSQLANQFKAGISVSRNGLTESAKSIMGVLVVAADESDRTPLRISATGPDAPAAMSAIAEFFSVGPRVEHCVEADCKSTAILTGYSESTINYACSNGHCWSIPRN